MELHIHSEIWSYIQEQNFVLCNDLQTLSVIKRESQPVSISDSSSCQSPSFALDQFTEL